jgi:type VI secretion system secreted protein Hcp
MKTKIPLLLLALLFSTSAAAITPMFLKMDPIKGESQDVNHKNQIDVLAWSWGTSSDGRQTCIQDISITKYVDSASPDLLMGIAEGTLYDEARLSVTKRTGSAEGGGLEYIVLTMTDVTISSVSTGGSGGEDRLTENVSLDFGMLKYEYTPQNADGSAGPTKEAMIFPQKCK